MRAGRMLWIVAALALLVRFFASPLDWSVWVDSMAYLNTARALGEGHWADAYIDRTPGYPLLMLLVSLVTGGFSRPDALFAGLGYVQMAFGVLVAVLVADAVRRLTGSWRWGLAAGVACALLPDSLLYEHACLSESLYTLALTALIWAAGRFGRALETPRGWLLAGLAAGGLMWIKPIGLALAFSLLCAFRAASLRHRLTGAGMLALGMILVLFPWVLFNARTHQVWTFSAGSGANQLYKSIDAVDWASPVARDYKARLYERYLLYAPSARYNAVNDVHVLMDRELRPQPDADSKPGAGKTYSEIYLRHDRQARLVSREAAWRDPLAYLGVTLREAGRWLWMGYPPGPLSEARQLIWQVLLALAAWGGICASGFRSPSLRWLPETQAPARLWRWTLAMHVALYAILTVADPRYRAPLEPGMVVLAALGLWVILGAQPVTQGQAGGDGDIDADDAPQEGGVTG